MSPNLRTESHWEVVVATAKGRIQHKAPLTLGAASVLWLKLHRQDLYPVLRHHNDDGTYYEYDEEAAKRQVSTVLKAAKARASR